MNTTTRKRADRREFVAQLLRDLPDALVVTGLGSPTYDVFAAGDRDKNYYLWGAMGGATSLALGLALAQPDKSVVVITGDGEQLMGITVLRASEPDQVQELVSAGLDAAFEAGEQVAVLLGQNLIGRKKWGRD